MITTVLNAETGEAEATYSLSPKEAIVACWEQSHRNLNTWEYAKKLEAEFYPLVETEHGFTLGKFWVKKESAVSHD